ncbi:MAG: nucleotidyltransferase domain-containing protein [Chloroflexota bacterium]|nr:nucleotidyltransferase domain-containing protein [Chloroflexota bacterium]
MEALAELCRRYHVRELALFGSILRDDFRDDSDVDMLVEYEPDARVGLYEHFDLQMELERLVGRKVDLISKRGLNVVIRDDVVLSSQVLYAA